VNGERKERRIAVILSGGGARGAYEVGVLHYIFDELSRIRGAPPRIDILCGTSVGAINACYLAAHLADPVLGMRRLVELWSEIELARVLGFGVRQMVGLPRLLWGGHDGSGVFDVKPMANMVQREISWRAVTRSLRRGHLRALSVSCTEVSTGRTVVFIQTAPNTVIPATSPPRTLYRADRIGPQHALASAAIPLLFPPARIDTELYLDGGLRQNTPISPALRLGATHVFAVGSSRDVRGVVASESPTSRLEAPGVAFLLGKILNAFLLDHVDVDIELLTRMNTMLADGEAAYGDDFLTRINAEAHRRGTVAYRNVECMSVRPSEDIGRVAAEHVRRGRFGGDAFFTKRMLMLLDFGRGDEADLASYLLFDGRFARELIEMGRADARARRDELLAFFGDKGDDARPGDGEGPLGASPSLVPPGV
jgi:NTE family protein